MKAITVRQPWAWAIIHGGKDIENRSRNIAGSYRGPLAIHAGLAEAKDAYEDDMIREALGRCDDSWELEERLGQRGAIIGVVDLVGIHRGSTRPFRWAMRDHWHLLLANPRPLPEPIPCRGALGLWTPPLEVLAECRAAIRGEKA